MRFVTATLCLAMLSSLPAAARAPRAELTVVNTGSEQGLKYGATLLARPFGAQLVDTIKIVGAYGATRERYYLVEGDAGATCPARYMIVTIRPGQPPALSAPFGTCGTGATVRSSNGGLLISVAPGPMDRLPVRYLFSRSGLRQLDTPSQNAAVASGAPGVRCASPQTPVATDRAAMMAEFDRVFPAYYRTARGVHRAEIAPDQLRTMVAGLACLSSYDDADSTLPKAATPLFASKRYGDASFAALDKVASMPGSNTQLRASARAFSATMHYYVSRREAF